MVRNQILHAGLAAALLSCLAATTARADYSSTVLSYNPLGYWRFNETAAAPPLNEVANSGNLGSIANGEIVMDVGKGEPGVIGNAIRLNNASSTIAHSGSKVDVPFNTGLATPVFTVEFWAKPFTLPATDATGVCPISFFNQNWYGGANRSGWLFYVNNAGKWNLRLGLKSGYALNLQAGTGLATVGNWQHIVATYDGTTATIYANGVQIASAVSLASATGWLPNSQSALRIGGTPLNGDLSFNPAPNFNATGQGHSGNRGWDGWIDEVAIYPSALSANAVSNHYWTASNNVGAYGATILADGPTGYWSMDEPAVTAPDPSTFPIVANSGSLGADADGTNVWGALTAQSGTGYGGLGAGDKAVYMNGESGAITLKDAAGLHFSGNITMMAWVKPTVQDYYRDIIAHGWGSTYEETFLRISRGVGGSGAGDGNYYEVGVTDNSGYYDAVLVPIPPGDIGNWVFLAGTYDGAGWKLYRNGTLVGSVSSTHGALDVADIPWAIGSRSNPSDAEGLRFGGWIDEPAIFNTALSAAAISTIYNAAQVPPVIIQPPQNPGTLYQGDSLTLSVSAEGSPTLGYMWLSNGVPTGVTATSISFNNLPAGTNTIEVVVTNPYGTNTASVTFSVVFATPAIKQQPVPLVKRFVGYPFSFSVGATGSSPLTYFWKLGSTVVQAGPSATYSNIASLANAGTYSVIVSNESGVTVTSSNAILNTIPVPSGYPGVVIADTPIAYWRLDESSGSSAYDAVGGNDGIYHSVTLGLPGYSTLDSNTAAGFGAVNTYIGSISGTGVNVSGHTRFTLEVWVKGPANQPDESTIIAKGNGSSGTTATEQFSLDVAGGKYRFFTRGSANTFFEADATVGPNGTWQHVVGVYDDDGTGNGSMYIYINGQQSGTGLLSPAGVRASTDPVTIGAKHLGNDPAYDGYFTGTIDEVAVYRAALSADQVLKHYAAAYGASAPPSISLEPVSVTNYVSLNATFLVSAGGSVPRTYQWKKGIGDLTDGGNISGSSTEKLTISPVTYADAGSYSVTIVNPLGQTNSAVVTLTVLAPPATAPDISGLAMHLPLDGNLVDATGRGNNGTAIQINGTSSNVVSASSMFVPDGMLGKGLHFSTDYSAGTTNNTYVTLLDRPDLHFSSNVNFTVSFWIRSPANYAGGDLPYFCSGVGSTFANPGIVFAYTYGYGTTPYPGGWAWSVFDSNNNGVGGRGEIGSVNDGNWHHLVHVFDRANGSANYLDGQPVNFNKQSGASIQSATASIDSGRWFTIGQDPTGTYAESGAGDIDDLGVWRKALTALEATSIYMAAVSNHLSFTGTLALPPASVSITRIAGTTINYNGGAGAQFVLLSSSSAGAPLTGWTRVQTNSATPGTFTIPAVGSSAQTFYSIKSE